jgi:peptide/nickel transport system ATP-binding protein
MNDTDTRPASDVLLSVENLRLESRSGRVVIPDLSFRVWRAQVTAIVGESGSGKTVAARAVMGLLPPGMRQTAGTIEFAGQPLQRLSPRAYRRLRGPSIGMVFQEPMVSLNPALTIAEQLAEGLRLHERLPSAAIRSRCERMLQRVRIEDPQRCLSAYPHEFSGGMRQRIMLASVMMLRPRLLIADEPTTALDNLSQREVLDLMVELARDTGTAVLLITHDLGVVARYAQHALVLQQGELVESGTASQIVGSPTHPYTRRLVGALPRRGSKAAPAAQGDAVISVRDLTVAFAERHRLFASSEQHVVLDRVSLDVRSGETVAVVGGSGSGKTTLGRAILGLLPRVAGTIRYRGRDLDRLDAAGRREFRLGCQLIFQDPFSSLNPRMRIRQTVAEPLRHVPNLSSGERERRTMQVLDEVGLGEFGDRFPHELSGGQRQRVAIARAIVRRPAFVVADEPVSALDMTIQMQILQVLERLQAQYGFACLFISHDLAVVEQVADRVVVLQAGRVVEQGSRDQIFDSPSHAYTRDLLAATPVLAPPQVIPVPRVGTP